MPDCSCHYPDWLLGSCCCPEVPFVDVVDLHCDECPWFWSDFDV